VTVDDGFTVEDGSNNPIPDFASPDLEMRYQYENGFYHRREKEFFGFEQVISQQVEVDAGGGETPRRTTIRTYRTCVPLPDGACDYPLKGLLDMEETKDGDESGPLLSRVRHELSPHLA
jgi:hypothetical protein